MNQLVDLSTLKRCALVLLQDFRDTDILKDAYSMAYVTLLSLVPSLAVTFALISLFTPFLGENSDLVMQAKSFILSHLATGSGEVVISYLESFMQNVDLQKIGFTGFIGTVASLVLLLHNIEGALNRIFQVEKSRNMLTRFIYFWTLITLGTFIVGLSIGAVSGFQWGALSDIRNGSSDTTSSLVYVLGIFIFFSLLFKIVPNRNVSTKAAAIGGTAASIMLLAAIECFGLYTGMVRTYEAIYGAALSAIPLFLLWMYVIWVIVLVGASIAWRTQMGFQHLEDHQGYFDDLSQAMRSHSQNLLRSKLPLMILIEIYRCHSQKGNEGFRGSGFERESGLPLSWIEAGLELLKDAGLIAACQTKDGRESYLPCQSAETLQLQDFQKLMNEPQLHSLQTLSEQRHLPFEYFKDPELPPQTSFDQILKNVAAQS